MPTGLLGAKKESGPGLLALAAETERAVGNGGKAQSMLEDSTCDGSLGSLGLGVVTLRIMGERPGLEAVLVDGVMGERRPELTDPSGESSSLRAWYGLSALGQYGLPSGLSSRRLTCYCRVYTGRSGPGRPNGRLLPALYCTRCHAPLPLFHRPCLLGRCRRQSWLCLCLFLLLRAHVLPHGRDLNLCTAVGAFDGGQYAQRSFGLHGCQLLLERGLCWLRLLLLEFLGRVNRGGSWIRKR